MTLKNIAGALGFFSSIVQITYSTSYTLGFDIELSGPSTKKHGIVSIGATVQDQDSNEVDQFEVNLSLPKKRGYDSKTKAEFWDKNPEAFAYVQKNPKSPQEGMQEFCAFLDKIEQKYDSLTVVSDNPTVDIAWLNFYLNSYTTRAPLNYSTTKGYRIIWDVNSMMKTLLMKTKGDKSDWGLGKKLGFTSKWQYDHRALNDARNIVDEYNQAVKLMQKSQE